MGKVRRGGPRRRPGRPKGSGGPPESIRRNRVVVLVTDSELAKLHRLARRWDLPSGTAAYQLLASALKRRRG